MKKLIYRPMERRDLDAVGEILNQAFGLYRYVTDSKMLQYLKKQYVFSCLSEATYTCVAQLEGKVVGIIMGNARNRYRLIKHIPAFVQMVWYEIEMVLRSFGHTKGEMKDFLQLYKIYDNFLKNHPKEFDGVLTLFAVEQDCRGLGVGKELLAGLCRHWQQYQTKRVYLYTDNTCNVGFYEHMGFRRLESSPLVIRCDGKPFFMDVYLYGYDVPKEI